MKKIALFVVVVLMASTAVVWAQTSRELDSIVDGPFGFTFKAKLSDGTTVTDTALGGNLSAGTVELLNVNPLTGQTNCTSTFDVIGSSLGTSNYIDTVNNITNVVITGMLLADNGDVSLGKGRQTLVYGQEGAILRGTRALRCGDCSPIPGFAIPQTVISNSTWNVVLTQHVSKTSTSFVGAVVGVWKDGETAFKGAFKSNK
jgi:hypothetical protein